MDIKILIAAGIIIVAVIIIIGWRASVNYGRFIPSKEATAAYESFRVDSNLNYYTSGPDAYPNAIIGIDNTWNLETDLWKKRDLDSRSMQEIVLNMQAKVTDQGLTLHGFDILDNNGKKIGNWFSIIGIVMVVKITGEKRAVVHPPPVDTYR